MLTGVEAWHGRFEGWNDHPPLARLLIALPLLGNFALQYSGKSPDAIQVHAMQPSPERAAWLTRPVNTILGVLLGILVWSAARHLFSEGAANFALALFAISPGLIAHYSVATTDGVGILTIFACALQVVRWRWDPGWRNTVLLGLLCGATLLAKFYTLPICCMVVVLVLALREESVELRPRGWNWKAAAAVILIAVVVVSAAYSFHVTRLQFHNSVLTATIPGRTAPLVMAVPVPGSFTIPLPAGEYGDGLIGVAQHNLVGHNSYLLGKVSGFGFSYYYPAVMALKWPVLVLALAVVGGALLAAGRMAMPGGLGVMLLFPAMHAVSLLASHIQIGDRHALPLYPFLLLLAAAVWQAAAGRRLAKIVLLAALAVQSALVLRIAPDYLSYFNPPVRTADAWRYVSDSNLDWGQGLIALRNWQGHHAGETLHLASFGSVDAALYGVRAVALAPGERVTGAVAVQMSAMSGQYLAPSGDYRWLLRYPVREVVNHSILIFDVPGARRESAE